MSLAFEPMDLARQSEYLEFLGASPSKPSDYSIVNLWGWSLFYGLEWAFDNDLIWIRQTRRASGDFPRQAMAIPLTEC